MANIKVNLISLREASARLSIGRTKLYGLINEGKVATLKIGCKRLVLESSLVNFVETQLDETRLQVSAAKSPRD